MVAKYDLVLLIGAAKNRHLCIDLERILYQLFASSYQNYISLIAHWPPCFFFPRLNQRASYVIAHSVRPSVSRHIDLSGLSDLVYRSRYPVGRYARLIYSLKHI